MTKVKTFILAAALALSACGGVDPYQYHYGVDCFRVQSELQLDPNILTYDVRLAESTLKDSHIIPDVCRSYPFGITVRVVAANNFSCADDYSHKCLGQEFFFDGSIVQARGMWTLVHELLHLWDNSHLAFGTVNHDGWETNGYDAAEQAYLRKERDPFVRVITYEESHPDGGTL